MRAKTENAFKYSSELKQLAIEFGYQGTITTPLYCNHTSAEYDEWRKQKDEEKNAKRFKSEGEAVIKIVQGPVDNPSSAGKKPNPESDTGNMKLGLSNAMKAALVTHCGLTPSQIDDMEERYN